MYHNTQSKNKLNTVNGSKKVASKMHWRSLKLNHGFQLVQYVITVKISSSYMFREGAIFNSSKKNELFAFFFQFVTHVRM